MHANTETLAAKVGSVLSLSLWSFPFAEGTRLLLSRLHCIGVMYTLSSLPLTGFP